MRCRVVPPLIGTCRCYDVSHDPCPALVVIMDREEWMLGRWFYRDSVGHIHDGAKLRPAILAG